MVPTSLVLSWMLGHVSVHCHHATDSHARRARLWVRVFQGLGESRQEVRAHIRLLLGLRWIQERIAWQHPSFSFEDSTILWIWSVMSRISPSRCVRNLNS